MAITRIAACLLLASQVSAPPPKPAAEKPASVVARIAVIGASASAGYNVHVSLSDALDAQIAGKHETSKNFSEEAFFLAPESMGLEQVARASEFAPTMVVAADFLFWFGYGEVSGEAERLENLELGLELLGKLKCPLIVSHFPDMSPAVGKMLLASQMPKQETLVKLNARVDAWAKSRGHVAFVAMPDLIEKLRAGKTLSVGGVEFKAPTAKALLFQSDDLHPTVRGIGVLARLCLDAACEPNIGAKPAEVRAEFSSILESLHKLDETRAAAERGASRGR